MIIIHIRLKDIMPQQPIIIQMQHILSFHGIPTYMNINDITNCWPTKACVNALIYDYNDWGVDDLYLVVPASSRSLLNQTIKINLVERTDKQPFYMTLNQELTL